MSLKNILIDPNPGALVMEGSIGRDRVRLLQEEKILTLCGYFQGSNIARLAKERGCLLGIRGANLEETAKITEKLTKEGFKGLVRMN